MRQEKRKLPDLKEWWSIVEAGRSGCSRPTAPNGKVSICCKTRREDCANFIHGFDQDRKRVGKRRRAKFHVEVVQDERNASLVDEAEGAGDVAGAPCINLKHAAAQVSISMKRLRNTEHESHIVSVIATVRGSHLALLPGRLHRKRINTRSHKTARPKLAISVPEFSNDRP